MLRRCEAGETLTSIGASFRLTRERVRQIVKRSGADMPRSRRCAVADCDKLPCWPRRFCHDHQLRFERYGDPLGTLPAASLLREQHGTYACYRDGGCRCDLCRQTSARKRREQFHRVHPEWGYRSSKIQPLTQTRVPYRQGHQPTPEVSKGTTSLRPSRVTARSALEC